MAGKVVILSAPSGSRKTTLARHLISVQKLNFKFSVSATTRKKEIMKLMERIISFIHQKNLKIVLKTKTLLNTKKFMKICIMGL